MKFLKVCSTFPHALTFLLIAAGLAVTGANTAFGQIHDAAGNEAASLSAEAADGPSMFLPSLPPIPGCRDGNMQTMATATHSGGGSGFFGPQKGNDGTFGPGGDAPTACDSWTWIGGGQYPSGAWYELEWAEPMRICQIWVDTKAQPPECGANPNRGLHGADIQTWDGASWVNHGSVTSATNDWGFVLPTCATTTRLRLFNIGPVSGEFQASNPVLHELKVYNCNPIEVAIDIKFCSDPNAFNCKKNGVLPVTIFGTEDFLVEDIDPSTLQLCTADLGACTGAPRDHSYADRGDPLLDLGVAECAIDPDTGMELDWTDNYDGYLDMDAAFEASEVKTILGDFCEDAAKGEVSEALVIIGETYDGVPIYSVPQDDNTGIDRLVKANK
jgi:hypothetical protein